MDKGSIPIEKFCWFGIQNIDTSGALIRYDKVSSVQAINRLHLLARHDKKDDRRTRSLPIAPRSFGGNFPWIVKIKTSIIRNMPSNG